MERLARESLCGDLSRPTKVDVATTFHCKSLGSNGIIRLIGRHLGEQRILALSRQDRQRAVLLRIITCMLANKHLRFSLPNRLAGSTVRAPFSSIKLRPATLQTQRPFSISFQNSLLPSYIAYHSLSLSLKRTFRQCSIALVEVVALASYSQPRR
jgi:hypothetical protein